MGDVTFVNRSDERLDRPAILIGWRTGQHQSVQLVPGRSWILKHEIGFCEEQMGFSSDFLIGRNAEGQMKVIHAREHLHAVTPSKEAQCA